MARIRQIIGGIFVLAFALLGMYCAVRGIQAHRDLNGMADVDDTVRNWSTGASACFVACAIAVTAAKKKRVAGQEVAVPWWKKPVVIVFVAALVFVVVVLAVLLLQPAPRAASVPAMAPPAPSAPPVPATR